MPMNATQHALARQYLADPGTSAVQNIQLENAAGGTFTITFSGQTTTPILFNAGANDVQNALAALSNIGVGNVTVNLQTGVPGASVWTIYFAGALANIAQPVVTVNTSGLSGIGIIVVIQQTVAGGVQAFSNSELDAFYDQALTNFFLSICYAVRALLANAAKFNDYVAGQSNEKKAQIFDHLKMLEELYQQWAQADRQVQIATLQPVPPRPRAVPYNAGMQVGALTIVPQPRRWAWRNRGGWGWW